MTYWVAFPKLGLEWEIARSFPLFGTDFEIYYYAVLITIGVVLAGIYGYIHAPRVGVDRERMLDVVLVAFVTAVVCARLYYVIFSGHLSEYLSDPIKILAIRDGGLAIYGGIIGAFVSGFLMCRVRKVSVLAMFDLASIGFLIGQGVGRWGNFVNQEAYGTNTALPWGMTGEIIQSGVNGVVADQTAPVHPTFLYESLWCLLGALVLHLVFTKRYRFKGQIFGLYLMWYGTERALIESLRTDSLMVGPFRVSQLVAVLAVLLGAALLVWLYKRDKKQKESSKTEELCEDTTISMIEEDV